MANSGGSTDLAGRVRRIKSQLGVESNYRVKGIDYGSHGLMVSMTLGNDLVERWTYNAKHLQPYDIRLGTASVEDSAGRWKFSYCAGALSGTDCTTNNGNVMNQFIQPLNIYQNYSYDELNRISVMEESTSVSASPACGSGSTPCRKFGYDNWSNMYVSATRVMSRASFTPSGPSNFNANNQLLIQGSGYDPAGNQTAIGGFTFAYDHEGRVKTSTLSSIATTYTYDGLGRRVSKSTGTAPNIVTTTFVYDASGNLAAEYGGAPSSQEGPRYLTTDHLGSTRLVTKQDQTPDRRIDYLPFGEFIPATVGGRTTAMKYEATETLAALTQRFTGKERDGETGLDYFGARYLSTAQGRFTSPDIPLIDQQPGDPQSWNLYSYVRNNPLTYRDPTGRICIFGIGNTCNDKIPPPPPRPPPPAPRNPGNPVYPTTDQAGAAAARENQQGQQRTGNEHASSVYALGPAFTYTESVTQNRPDTVDPNNPTGYYDPRTAPLDAPPIPAGTALVGESHSHPGVIRAADGRPAAPRDQLSPQDILRSQDLTSVHPLFHASYVGLPGGRVIKYEPRAPSGKRVKVVK